MEWKDKKEVLTGLWTKYKGIVLILVVGLLLLSWPSKEQTVQTAQTIETAGWETPEETESRMERLLEQIEGVGRLSLMLTMESGTRQELTADTELSYSGATAAPEEYSRKTETVIVSTDQGDAPVVAYQVGPVYRGAVVVCQGAENAGVRLAVTQAVAALTGLGSDRIMVIKCQS